MFVYSSFFSILLNVTKSFLLALLLWLYLPLLEIKSVGLSILSGLFVLNCAQNQESENSRGFTQKTISKKVRKWQIILTHHQPCQEAEKEKEKGGEEEEEEEEALTLTRVAAAAPVTHQEQAGVHHQVQTQCTHKQSSPHPRAAAVVAAATLHLPRLRLVVPAA